MLKGMDRIAICLLVAALFAAPALADEPPRPVSKRAKFFRLVVGADDPLTALGFIDESRGTGRGFDRAVLDLDGDGVPESVQEFVGIEPFLVDGATVPQVFLRVRHGEATYHLTVYGLYDPPRRSGDYHSAWSVSRTDLVLSFMSSRAPLHDSLAKAKAGKPIRLGGPFTFRARTRVEGPKAVLDVSLRDPMRGNLNAVVRKGVKEHIRVRICRGEAVVAEGRVEYG
jgi:hypothetical protein